MALEIYFFPEKGLRIFFSWGRASKFFFSIFPAPRPLMVVTHACSQSQQIFCIPIEKRHSPNNRFECTWLLVFYELVMSWLSYGHHPLLNMKNTDFPYFECTGDHGWVDYHFFIGYKPDIQWNLTLWTPHLCGHPVLVDTFLRACWVFPIHMRLWCLVWW